MLPTPQRQDVAAAVAWIRTNAASLGVNPDRIAIWGHSAGAHLAIHTAVFDPERAEGIRCAIGVAGPYNLLLEENKSMFGEMMVRNFLRDPEDPMGTGEGAEDAIRARAREASPVNHLDRSDPPLLLIQEAKITVPLCPSQGYGGGGHGRGWKSISDSILRLVMCPPIPMSSEPFLDLWTGTSAPVAGLF